jgi:hypothetical protein
MAIPSINAAADNNDDYDDNDDRADDKPYTITHNQQTSAERDADMNKFYLYCYPDFSLFHYSMKESACVCIIVKKRLQLFYFRNVKQM